MNEISEIFNNAIVNEKRAKQLASLPEPVVRYVIAITPRSGSTYLSSVLTLMGQFGKPVEPLGKKILAKKADKMPAHNPDEYARNTMRIGKSDNGVSGIKVSWFQFRDFIAAMDDSRYFADFKFIYLTRQNLEAQAVSLYKATASSVFHTNGKHDEEALKKLAILEYNFTEIDYWYQHIVNQEKGWQQYFLENQIEPLCITYEEIERDILAVIKRIAFYLNVDPNNVVMPETESVFKKISDSRNVDWASRFALEKQDMANSLQKQQETLITSPISKLKEKLLRAIVG